uniref:Uncharacterized protein n=1 Tax=Molossus molossus TaxID=27622 RepID=A0A7J8BJ20_MOLMO|nr:hypothetical protein HJG59_010229 [Molossus molossus]
MRKDTLCTASSRPEACTPGAAGCAPRKFSGGSPPPAPGAPGIPWFVAASLQSLPGLHTPLCLWSSLLSPIRTRPLRLGPTRMIPVISYPSLHLQRPCFQVRSPPQVLRWDISSGGRHRLYSRCISALSPVWFGVRNAKACVWLVWLSG